jgi:hypothetical protein
MNPATALLETLVHMEIDSEDRPERFQVLRIEGPDTLSIEEIRSGWAGSELGRRRYLHPKHRGPLVL